MFKKKPPVINIGSSLSTNPTTLQSQNPLRNSSVKTSAQPSAIERSADALGELIWKSAPVTKSVIIGTFGLLQNFGSLDEDQHGDQDKRLRRYDQAHPDYDYWNG